MEGAGIPDEMVFWERWLVWLTKDEEVYSYFTVLYAAGICWKDALR